MSRDHIESVGESPAHESGKRAFARTRNPKGDFLWIPGSSLRDAPE
jgi:hypothetical protein